MDDNDERPRLPMHLILGNSECPRNSTTEPQRVGGEWDPVANYNKLGWTITSPGKEVDTTSMVLTQTSRVDYEDLSKLDVLGLANSPSGDHSRSSYKGVKKGGTKPVSHGKETTLPCQLTKTGAYADWLALYGNWKRPTPSTITTQ